MIEDKVLNVVFMVDIFESMKLETLPTHSDIILFDGVCNLCNESVNFVLRNDSANVFIFASLQSDWARRIIGNRTHSMNSLVCIRNGEMLTQSSAVFAILKHLNHPIRILRVFRFLPKSFTDFVYRMIAKNRYRLFGKSKKCMVPNDSLKHRFL